ncbi:MAG TPA: agmatinase [Clostridia bacterium]|nr:agmatinase [Clostridia bacterium]
MSKTAEGDHLVNVSKEGQPLERVRFVSTTFCGCDCSFESSRFALFGAPFDGAASFRTGARFAPSAMRRDSWGLETYSPYLDRALEDICVSDLGDLDLPSSAARALDCVEALCVLIQEAGKIPVMIGGDHSMTLGAVRASRATYPDLHIVHLDAHTDLRDDYLGDPLSHASVMRRCHDLLGDDRIHSFGIRSGLREEFQFARDHNDLSAFSFDEVPAVLETIGDAPVYVTVDLDVLDPSILPGTGTPEPAGVTFSDMTRALTILGNLRIVGTDFMELAPTLDLSGVSTAVACKLLREWLLLIR